MDIREALPSDFGQIWPISHQVVSAGDTYAYAPDTSRKQASTNVAAVRLWKKLGFTEVGRLPGAFNHPAAGYVDALVMYKWLSSV